MKLLFVSLGCDKNLVDSEYMIGMLTSHGIELTDDETEADIIIVNSCCFIGDAKEESINTILQLAELKTEGQLKALIVCGCLAQRYKDEIQTEIPEVDAVLGTTSYGDITRYFAEQGILFNGKGLIRPTLAQMLRNPVYVQADLDVYEFFKSQGTVIVNDAADFTGMNGCYLYQGRDVKPSKKNDLKDQMLVLAPHEGIVPSDIWLTCRKKLMNNMKIQSARKATHTWLAGKIKCGNCGYALMSIFNPSGKQYLRCTKRLDNKSCPGCGKIITSELEAVVYQQMVKKLASYKTLTGRKKAAKANPKIAALQVELAHVDSEIEKLVDSLTGANNVLLSYVNVKIAELDGRKQELLARIAELTVEAISPEQVSQISGYLDTWENVSFDDKRRVVDLMITTIAATSDSLNIIWKI